MSKITVASDLSNLKPEDLQRYLSIWVREATSVINGDIGLENLDFSSIVPVTFQAPTTIQAVSHGLGRTPVGYLVISMTTAMIVFDGTAAATDSVYYLQASASGVARIIFF